MEISKVLALALKDFPNLKYRVMEENKWYVIDFYEKKERFIITKRSIRNESVAYSRIRDLKWYVKERL